VESLKCCRRLKTNHEDNCIQVIQQRFLVTQLRDVLAARDSPEPAQKHQQHGSSTE